MEGFSGLASIIAAFATGAYTFLKSIQFVREGEQGIKLRFGRAVRVRGSHNTLEPKVYEPGFAILIPFVDVLVRRHVRVQTVDLPQQTITIKNGLSYIVDAVIRFRVVGIYKALFVVDDLDRTMTNVAMQELRDTVSPYETAEDMANVQDMSEKLTNEIRKHCDVWGVEIEQFSIVSCVPTPESQQIVNVSAGVKTRVAALVAGFKQLGLETDQIGNLPQLAAALVGIPVATAIGISPASSSQFESTRVKKPDIVEEAISASKA